MRGADGFQLKRKSKHSRFIPTCVGQISSIFMPALYAAGSSPHAWGRFFPDHRISKLSSVHPHMRGADVTILRRPKRTVPVHPHMRGADNRPNLGALIVYRFIPTCVGQITTVKFCRIPLAVHPHMRGADARSTLPLVAVTGSSPHAWGRYIPIVPVSTGCTVHPHMRGADISPSFQ